MRMSVGQAVGLASIRAYKRVVSPWLRPACRFTPTCSEYAYDAISRHGFWRGGLMAMRRLGSCHPLHRGGFDPV